MLPLGSLPSLDCNVHLLLLVRYVADTKNLTLSHSSVSLPLSLSKNSDKARRAMDGRWNEGGTNHQIVSEPTLSFT
jgi:hypothetical protein